MAAAFRFTTACPRRAVRSHRPAVVVAKRSEKRKIERKLARREDVKEYAAAKAEEERKANGASPHTTPKP